MQFRSRLVKAVAIGACFVAFPTCLLAQADQAAQRAKVLIGFAQLPGASEEALVRAFGGTVSHTYHLIPAIAAEVPQAALQGLRNHPLVTVVEDDVTVREVDAELDNSWGVKHIGSGIVHDAGNKGVGAKVCVIDSGIDVSHPDLWPAAPGSWDFVDNDSDPTDGRGHGTHVTGTIGGRDNGSGVVGVAPDAEIIALRILDNNGSGDFSNAIAAVERCLDLGGHITNNSYGSSQDPGSLVRAAFDNSYAAGLLHVAASGNASIFRCNSIGFPARYESVIAVGATNSNNSLASWSCKGSEQELVAPGVNIYSTLPDEGCGLCTSSSGYANGYGTVSGTSMASPHVAGVAALAYSCGVTDATEIRQRLISTADDLGSAGRDSTYGYGLVDADEAVANCGPVDDPPTISITSPENGATVVGTVVVSANADDDVEVSRVEFFVGETSIGVDIDGLNGWSADWDTTGVADSVHSVSATATDTAGKTASASVSVTVDNVDDPPTVTITGPAAGSTVSGSVEITALASDDKGVSRVEFYVDGSLVSTDTDGDDGWSASWNTEGYTDAAHTLGATAVDTSEQDTSTSVSVNVNNSPASMELSASGYKVRGLQAVDLAWTGSTATNITVYRDGAEIATTANGGSYTDNIDARGGGSYTYQVCEAGSTSVCSNTATVVF
jgi:subtilisin